MLALLNPQGRTLWRKEKQTLWGLLFSNEYRQSNPLNPQMLFAGQWFDEESGLAYNRFRYYDPESGNYLSIDPIHLKGGKQLYRYTPNSIDITDYFGLYNGKGSRELGVYHVFYQHSLDPTEFKLSDTIQFRQANKSLYEKMRSDPSFRKTIQSKYPGTWEHVQPSKRGNFSAASPPGTTWHHADKPGALQLVNYKDHRTYHKVYHPDGTGGRNKWGGGTSCRK